MAPPVLLVHGFGTSAAATWRDNGWLDLLADEGRETIAPDLLGHGNAEKPHDPNAYSGLEERIADVLPEQPVDGIGFSLGARVLLTLAADRPERFRRLVLAGVGANLLRGDDPEVLATAISSDAAGDHPWAAYFHRLAHEPGNDPEALTAFLRRPHSAPLNDTTLARVTMPTLVVIGELDFAGPGDPLVAGLPDARLVVLPRTDHFSTPKSMGLLEAALAFIAETP